MCNFHKETFNKNSRISEILIILEEFASLIIGNTDENGQRLILKLRPSAL